MCIVDGGGYGRQRIDRHIVEIAQRGDNYGVVQVLGFTPIKVVAEYELSYSA